MQTTINFEVDSDVYEKFDAAVSFSNDNKNTVIESLMKRYIVEVFQKLSNKYGSKNSAQSVFEGQNNSNGFRGKANERIPKWAKKPEQYNHKIIRAFFMAEEVSGDDVTLSQLEQMSCELGMTKNQFYSNYHQMKADGLKTHGKVFEDNGRYVWIWDEVKDTLLNYKDFFYKSEK